MWGGEMKKFIATGLFAFLVLGTSIAFAFDYTLAIEGGGTEDLSLYAGDIVDLELDSTDLDMYIYGNVQIEFDPAKVEAVYFDESFVYWGFWSQWTGAPGNPDICGGGEPYFYAMGYGSYRGDLYAIHYGDFMAGPSAFIDNVNGVIRFYHMNYLIQDDYEPVRLGFRIIEPGPVDFSIKSNSAMRYDWCEFDAEAITQFMFGEPLTPEEMISEMIMMVSEDFDLPKNLAKFYVKKLEKIQRALDKEKVEKALKEIGNLIRKVEHDISRARIGEENGGLLIEMLYRLADRLSE